MPFSERDAKKYQPTTSPDVRRLLKTDGSSFVFLPSQIKLTWSQFMLTALVKTKQVYSAVCVVFICESQILRPETDH